MSTTAMHVDLLFEVVLQRNQARRPIVLSTDKPFGDWGEVFPGHGCVAARIDRRVHRSEIIVIDAGSYRP